MVYVEVLNNKGEKTDLFNSNGAKIGTYKLLNNKAVIDTHNLKPGCYFIAIYCNRITEYRKLIISK